MRITKFAMLIMAFALIFAAACKTQKSQETRINQIPVGDWILKTMGGEGVSSKSAPKGMPTIVFNDSTSFSGSTGCNQYRATYKGNDENIAIKMGPMTKMACPGAIEKQFLNAISATNRVKLDQGTLSFYENDKPLMTFRGGDKDLK